MKTDYRFYSARESSFVKQHYKKRGATYCAKQLNISIRRTRRIASKLKIRASKAYISKMRASIILNRDPKIHIDKFISSFTPESAYILGLLWADGHIVKKNNLIRLSCLSRDMIYMLRPFRLTGSWNISHYKPKKGQAQTVAVACNRKLSQFLKKCDYTSKSYKSADRILAAIPVPLHRYFFRGLSDGDGCFYADPRGRAGLQIQYAIISGRKQDWSFVEKLFKTLDITYHVRVRICKEKGRRGQKIGSSMITIQNLEDIVKLGKYLYEGYPNDNIGLPRKYNIYNQIVDHYLHTSRKFKHHQIINIDTKEVIIGNSSECRSKAGLTDKQFYLVIRSSRQRHCKRWTTIEKYKEFFNHAYLCALDSKAA